MGRDNRTRLPPPSRKSQRRSHKGVKHVFRAPDKEDQDDEEDHDEEDHDHDVERPGFRLELSVSNV